MHIYIQKIISYIIIRHSHVYLSKNIPKTNYTNANSDRSFTAKYSVSYNTRSAEHSISQRNEIKSLIQFLYPSWKRYISVWSSNSIPTKLGTVPGAGKRFRLDAGSVSLIPTTSRAIALLARATIISRAAALPYFKSNGRRMSWLAFGVCIWYIYAAASNSRCVRESVCVFFGKASIQ